MTLRTVNPELPMTGYETFMSTLRPPPRKSERPPLAPDDLVGGSAKSSLSEASSAMTPASAGFDTRDSTVSVVILRALVHSAELSGVPSGKLLDAVQIDAKRLEMNEERLPRWQFYRVCEVALELLGNPALGLHWAERVTDRPLAPVSHLIANGSTLRQCFQLLAQFVRLLSDDAGYRIVEEDDQVTIISLPIEGESERIQRLVAEMTMTGFLRLIQSFRRDARPVSVSFDYPAPDYHAEYARIFEGTERFEQPRTALVFARELLDAPSPQKDDEVREALQSVAERRLLRLTDGMPYALRVREYLLREGWPDHTDMESVAKALDTSERSLRRRLADEGKSYSDIVNDALATIAKTFLRGRRHTIQEVAYEMGFSDPSTFHRAFRRWTGMTPTEYRSAQSKQDGRK